MRTMSILRALGLAAVSAALVLAAPAPAQTPDEIQKAVNAAYEKYKDLKEGRTPTTSRPSPRSTRRSTASRS